MSFTHYIATDLEDPTITWQWFQGPGGWDERIKTAPFDPTAFERVQPGEGSRSGWPGAVLVDRADRRRKEKRAHLTYLARVALTQDEGRKIEDQADREGITLSALVRRFIRAALDAPPSEPRVDSVP